MNIDFIELCIINAINLKSKITNERNVLNISGMCGQLTRHLYNNICSHPHINYLEIGCWQGASTISSLYKNNHVNATIIDNWSDFSNQRFNFSKNISKFVKDNSNIQLINQDCFSLRSDLIYYPYNVFLYDACHDQESQRMAITYFWKYLDKISIIIIDDWNWKHVRAGTIQGLKEMNAKIIYHKQLLDPLGPNGFWNGCGIFLVEKDED